MSATNGEGDRQAEGIIFLVHLIKIRETHRDIKEHTNNKVIINLNLYLKMNSPKKLLIKTFL